MADLAGVIRQLKKERNEAAKLLAGLDAALAALGGGRKATGTRYISAAGRARIAAAQRARWARVKGNTKNKSTVSKRQTLSRRTAGKRIAASAKESKAGVIGAVPRTPVLGLVLASA